jgi:hypothetical protein
MSAWLAQNWVACMNYVAWGLSAFLLTVILLDFVRVEKDKRSGGQ